MKGMVLFHWRRARPWSIRGLRSEKRSAASTGWDKAHETPRYVARRNRRTTSGRSSRSLSETTNPLEAMSNPKSAQNSSRAVQPFSASPASMAGPLMT